MRSIFVAALVALVSATELSALKNNTKVAIANSVANAKGAKVQI